MKSRKLLPWQTVEIELLQAKSHWKAAKKRIQAVWKCEGLCRAWERNHQSIQCSSSRRLIAAKFDGQHSCHQSFQDRYRHRQSAALSAERAEKVLCSASDARARL